MVHVSTAYSNCHLDQIDEKFYHYPMSYKQLTAMISELDDRTVEDITPQILGHWPNTYAFTKAMAENYIYENRLSMPVAVFRPAVVVSTWKEPIQVMHLIVIVTNLVARKKTKYYPEKGFIKRYCKQL